MGKKDKRWVMQRKNDFYYKLAKQNHYRSRASYKLLQLNEKFEIIYEGDKVVDLGCAPGGWLQASHDLVGEDGFVIGVDLQKVKPLREENIVAFQGDMTKKETINKIIDLMPSKADVVICDASPNISGVWEVDHSRSIELSLMALIATTHLLRKNGNFVVKVFQGSLFDQYVQLLTKHFKKVQTTKPKASRSVSAEVYVIGKKFLGNKFDKNTDFPIIKLIEDNEFLDKYIEETHEKNETANNNEENNKNGLMIKKIKELRKKRSKL
jgi:23S rRNA (uridine2552-2'-O)-methyltransferase